MRRLLGDVKAVCIVGASDAGKTTLVERLLARLTATVGTVKSIHHDIELDDPGKDTYRHRVAGATRVVGVTPSLTASFRPVGKANGDGVALSRALAEFDDATEVVLVEGFASAGLPTVVVGDPDAVSPRGDVLARVPSGEAADVDALADAIRTLPDVAPDDVA